MLNSAKKTPAILISFVEYSCIPMHKTADDQNAKNNLTHTAALTTDTLILQNTM